MADHGTRGGYQQHLRERTPTCDDCRWANSEHQRRMREEGRVGRGNGLLSSRTWVLVRSRAEAQGLTPDAYVRHLIDAYDLL